MSAVERTLKLMRPADRERAREHAEGYLDLLEAAPQSTGTAQDLMLSRLVPAIYERWWRPALGRVVKGATGPGMEEEIRIARLLCGLAAGHEVLDLACGPANFTRSFARTVGADGLAVGLDASETMLARGARDTAAAGIGNLALIRADGTDLPFADGSFDAVCCFGALHLFAEPSAALDEMTRVLAPGGRIALMTSVRRQVALPPLKAIAERASGMKVFEQDEIVDALGDRGYTDTHQRLSGLIQFVGARIPA